MTRSKSRYRAGARAASSFELSFLDTHPVPTAPYGDLIHSAARRYQVNPELVRAVIRCESAFNPWATSPRGAAGLMQLMPATAERFGITSDDRWDPARNLDAGVAYLRWLVDHFDRELPLVLAAFNSGEGAVQRYNGIPPYRETREYVRRVYSELGLQPPEHRPPAAPAVVASAPPRRRALARGRRRPTDAARGSTANGAVARNLITTIVRSSSGARPSV